MTDCQFSISLTVRVNDLNYANHVAHQNYFSFFQEARIAYLAQLGFSELDIDGYGMILTEATCKYKQQLWMNDTIQVGCRVSALAKKHFIMDYQILKMDSLCAEGRTVNLCYDYSSKKIVDLPQSFVRAVERFEQDEGQT